MINLTFEERELIKTMCDLCIRNNGIAQIKPVMGMLEKILMQDVVFSEDDKKFIQQLCDISVRATGLSSLEPIVKLLKKVLTPDGI